MKKVSKERGCGSARIMTRQLLGEMSTWAILYGVEQTYKKSGCPDEMKGTIPNEGRPDFLVNSIQWVGSTRPVTCRASRLAGNSATAVDRWCLVGVAVI